MSIDLENVRQICLNGELEKVYHLLRSESGSEFRHLRIVVQKSLEFKDYLQQGQTNEDDGKLNLARRNYLQAVALFPEHTGAQLFYCWTLAKQGSWKRLIEQIPNINGDACHYLKGYALYKLGHFQEALDEWEQIQPKWIDKDRNCLKSQLQGRLQKGEIYLLSNRQFRALIASEYSDSYLGAMVIDKFQKVKEEGSFYAGCLMVVGLFGIIIYSLWKISSVGILIAILRAIGLFIVLGFGAVIGMAVENPFRLKTLLFIVPMFTVLLIINKWIYIFAMVGYLAGIFDDTISTPRSWKRSPDYKLFGFLCTIALSLLALYAYRYVHRLIFKESSSVTQSQLARHLKSSYSSQPSFTSSRYW